MKWFVAVTGLLFLSNFAFAAPQKRDVVSHYAVLAHAVYEDSLIAARVLQKAVHRLIANPTEQNLAAARSSVEGVARSLPAERGLSLRQRHR